MWLLRYPPHYAIFVLKRWVKLVKGSETLDMTSEGMFKVNSVDMCAK